jgi:hypothetical protein
MLAVAISSFSGGCMAKHDAQFRIVKQVDLSPGHQVMPYNVTRFSNGDIVVFGAHSQLNYHPWAARLNASGQILWEYINGGQAAWTDETTRRQNFVGALELPDGKTLLCGVKFQGDEAKILLEVLDIQGRSIAERLWAPVLPVKQTPPNITCVSRNGRATLLGALGGSTYVTGYFAELDNDLNVTSEKFDNRFAATDVQVNADKSLLLINFLSHPFKLLKLNSDLEVEATVVLDLPGDMHFVKSAKNTNEISIFSSTPSGDAILIGYDSNLHRGVQALTVSQFGIEQALQLEDGSKMLFGARVGISPELAVAQVYGDRDYRVVSMEPTPQTGWYYDAVAIKDQKYFAATRLIGLKAVVDFIAAE